MSEYLQLNAEPQLSCRVTRVIEDGDWDCFVTEVYGRPYCYQQQDGCRDRGVMRFTASADGRTWGFDDATPEELDARDGMGVSLKSWLAADGKDSSIPWDRNFYPELEEVAQDLCKRGLVPPGSYTLNIDW